MLSTELYERIATLEAEIDAAKEQNAQDQALVARLWLLQGENDLYRSKMVDLEAQIAHFGPMREVVSAAEKFAAIAIPIGSSATPEAMGAYNALMDALSALRRSTMAS